jgi:hypothetical protein
VQNVDDAHGGKQEECYRGSLSQIGQKNVLGNILLHYHAIRLYASQKRLIALHVAALHEVGTETDIQYPAQRTSKDRYGSLVDMSLALRGYKEEADYQYRSDEYRHIVRNAFII